MTLQNKSYRCGLATEPLLYETIGNCFDRIATQYPDRAALVVRHQDIRWNYAEYKQQVERLATGLLALGIEKGDRVGIWAPNCYEWCMTQFATAKIGAIMVCINPAYGLRELEYALNKVQCKAIIMAEQFKSSNYLELLQELAPELERSEPGKLEAKKFPHLKIVIRMGDAATLGMLNFGSVCDMGTEDERRKLAHLAVECQPDDPINIQFTSGTTGSPKGATLTHCNILNNGKIVGDDMRLSEQDRICVPLPLYHCFGMVLGNLASVSHGSTAVFPADSFDPLSTLETIAEERCTALYGVPTMFIAELEHPQFKDFDLTSLRTGIMGGAPCPVEVMKRVMTDMHMSEILIAYGQTETSPANHTTATDAPLEKRVGTVGKPGPHLEIKIVDAQGRVVPVGEKGEICCRGYAVMQSYWGDEEKTQETIDSAGWLHSGDLGVMDEEGYMQIVGRIKELIIRGGENIYPREIEEFLFTHPKIQNVQVVGVPDEKLGEQVCAWIQLQENEMLDADAVKQFCKGQIAHFKVPHYIKIVDAFPMTVTGKVQKFKIREIMEQEINETK